MSIPAQKPETRKAPSIVARLMGMDTIPPGRSTVIDAKESKLPKVTRPNVHYSPRKDPTFDGSPRSAPFRQTKGSLLSYGTTTNSGNGSNIKKSYNHNKNSKKDNDGPQKSKRTSSGVPPRRHPQEEALQKFKRDFEAYQSSTMVEKSKGLVEENSLQKGKHIQILAQEKLVKEKMAKYVMKKQNTKEMVQAVLPKKESHVSEATETQERPSLSTRIVILKPSVDPKNQTSDPFLGFSNSNNRDCTMVDFLEEVKERLRSEIEGKARSIPRKQKDGKNEIITTDPKEIARDIAKQIRETVTRDFEKKLTRSRSFKLPNYVPDTSELVRRDTKRILSEKLKNVLRNEVGSERPSTSMEPPRASFIIKRRERVKSMSEFPCIINRKDKRNETRFKLDSTGMVDAEMASPRSLFRSFSAPISGTSFGKRLVEDLGSAKSTHLGLRAEDEEDGLSEEKKGKEHGSGFKGKVSNLTHNLNLREKLFGNKTHTVKTKSDDFLPFKVLCTIPSALTNPGNNQDNYTEMPPSPASVSSSSHNEFSGGDNPSPVSPLEVSSHASRKSFGDLSFSISDASPKMLEKEEETEEAEFTENPKDTDIIEFLTPEMAYLKEILVIAGLYENNNTNERNLYINFAPRSLSFQIFEQMEEAYQKNIITSTEDPSQTSTDFEIDRRVLFDLANESVETLYGPTRHSDTLSEWVGTNGALPSGRIMLDEIWKQVDAFINPPMDHMQTIDSMVGQDVNTDAWTNKLYEDKDVLCKKISVVIYMELLDDFVKEMGSTV